MQKFWELLKSSVLMQGALALMFGGTVCYLWLTGQQVPEMLASLVGLILGFYFGSKAAGAGGASQGK